MKSTYTAYKPKMSLVLFAPTLLFCGLSSLISKRLDKVQEGLLISGICGLIFNYIELNELKEHQEKFIQDNTKIHLINSKKHQEKSTQNDSKESEKPTQNNTKKTPKNTQSEKFIYTVKPLLEGDVHLDKKMTAAINNDIVANVLSIIAGGMMFNNDHAISTCAILFATISKFIAVSEIIANSSKDNEYEIVKYDVDYKPFDNNNLDDIALLNSQ